MSVRQYIGARYVPRFSPVNGGVWDNTYSYEALEIVKYGNDYYTSRKAVPTGVAITNTEYWVLTGNYNGAINALDTRLTSAENNLDDINAEMPSILKGLTYNTIDKYGIKNDGLTDNTVAFNSVNDNIALRAGTYVVNGAVVFDNPVVFCGGAIMQIAQNASVIFKKGIIASPFDVLFSGNGSVKVKKGYAEWFGCERNNDAFDNSSALNKAIESCDDVILNGGTYYVNNTVHFYGSGKTITGQGNGANWNSDTDSVIATLGTVSPILEVGSTTEQSWHNRLANFGVWRKTVSDKIGVLIHNTWSTYFDDVMVRDWTCIKMENVTGCRFYKCPLYIRHDASTVGYGWYIDNTSNPNVSTYIVDCPIAGASGATSVGVYFKGGSDLFIDKLESGFCRRAIFLDGNNQEHALNDIIITNSVLDNNALVGIDIFNCNKCNIVIDNCYFYGGNSDFRIENIVNGNINISNCLLTGTGTNTAFGIKNAEGVTLRGNQIKSHSAYIDAQETNKHCIFEDSFECNVSAITTLMYFANLYDSYIKPNVYGDATIANVIYSGTFAHNEYNVTNIKRTGNTNLLFANGVAYNATGSAGSSLISGVI